MKKMPDITFVQSRVENKYFPKETFYKYLILLVVLFASLSRVAAYGNVCAPPESVRIEKIYLHLDNTSYFNGDRIWFKAYVVNAAGNNTPTISNTLYVELLNPGGELIDRKILKITQGTANGNFTINHLPFYPGCYEIRAYTKYMLNFGDYPYFSRVIPIFDTAVNKRYSTDFKIYKRVKPRFKDFRKSPKKGKKLNLSFFPEGGCLIKGIPSRVAFEATDASGKPIDVTGYIMTDDTVKAARLEVSHEGKGIFEYTPGDSDAHALIIHEDKKYKFDIPKALDAGYAMAVDNLSNQDCVKVKVSKSRVEGKDTVGIILLCQGNIADYTYVASTFEKPLNMTFDKSLCPSGVSEIILVDSNNEKIANRYIFNRNEDTFLISTQTDKQGYDPFEPITVSFALKDKHGSPITAPFSLSIRDGSNEMKWNRNILTDLLLMSDIKGYVSNPSYYFESDDEEHLKNLDLLLMVQGWEKSPYNLIKSIGKSDLRYTPETKGIAVDGTVSYYNLKKPRPDVDVSMLLVKRGREDEENSAYDFFENKLVTDSLGRFNFIVDAEGDWNLVLAASKELKRKNLTISLDNQFSPDPRRYMPYELEFEEKQDISTEKSKDEISSNFMETNSTLPMDSTTISAEKGEKTTTLKELEVKGKRSSIAEEMHRARAGSVAYYDFKENADRLYDEGFYYCDDVNAFLCKVNRNFIPIVEGNFKYLTYHQQLPLVVVDYERTKRENEFEYNNLPVEWIKSVYVSENETMIGKYCDPRMPKSAATKIYGCVVFIETYPENERPASAAIGVRKTTFHGYDHPSEFYNPDYSLLQPEPEDYRRTLYWNPNVTPDSNGNVQINLFNSNRHTLPVIDAQTVTPGGMFGVGSVCSGDGSE